MGGGAYAVFIAPIKMREEKEDRMSKGAAMMYQCRSNTGDTVEVSLSSKQGEECLKCVCV